MDDAALTSNCREVLRFEEIFATMLDGTSVKGSVRRRPRMTLPEGPSTQAGVQARMAVVLEPAEHGEPSLRVGWIDVVGRRAGLLSHEAVSTSLRARAPRTKARIDRDGYEGFLTSCRRVLVIHGIEVALETESRTTPLPAAAEPQRSGLSALELAFAAAVGIAACGATLAVLW